MRLQLAVRRLALVVGLAFVPSVALADGVLNLRHAYYKERSTRVQQPMVDASLDAGKGRVDAHFLVDSITSASTATGNENDEFNERRYEVGFGYSHELPAHIRLGGMVRFSTEKDYKSTFVGGTGEIALLDQTTTLRLFVGSGFDSINNVIAVERGSLGTPRRDETLATLIVSAGVSQVLTPRAVASLTYDFARLSGYQANMYRIVRGGSDQVLERVPETRLRHAITASARAYLPTRTTAAVSYRLYADDWGVVAHTPEIRLIQEIVPGLDLRLRYRFYGQGGADFYEDIYTQAELSDMSSYVTDDEKLGEMSTHTFGAQVALTLSTIGFHGLFGRMRVDAVVERTLQSTSFGDAWAAQAGLAVPFEY